MHKRCIDTIYIRHVRTLAIYIRHARTTRVVYLTSGAVIGRFSGEGRSHHNTYKPVTATAMYVPIRTYRTRVHPAPLALHQL